MRVLELNQKSGLAAGRAFTYYLLRNSSSKRSLGRCTPPRRARQLSRENSPAVCCMTFLRNRNQSAACKKSKPALAAEFTKFAFFAVAVAIQESHRF